MRKLALVLAAALLGLGLVGQAASGVAAAESPKVAIIVGATGTTTARYRTYADEIYAEAIKYTPNVVRVYSPNATWKRVTAAVNGASIVVYLGHGNGWPSPYTFDPLFSTKDGFGLNKDLNHDGKRTNSELKYYGEPKIRTLTPGAERRRAAVQPVLRLGELGARAQRPEPGDGEAAGRQLRVGVPASGRRRRDRERPQPRPVLHRGAVHDQPDARRVLARGPGLP